MAEITKYEINPRLILRPPAFNEWGAPPVSIGVSLRRPLLAVDLSANRLSISLALEQVEIEEAALPPLGGWEPISTNPLDIARLPDNIARGATGGPQFSTIVLSSRGGREQRTRLQELSKYQFDISYGIRKKEDIDAVRDFFLSAGGRHRIFRFRDLTDYQSVDHEYAIADGISTKYKLGKIYKYGEESYFRPIRQPLPGVIFNPVGTFNYYTGYVTYASPPAQGTSLKWTGDFDLLVRFDIDELDIHVEYIQRQDIPSIPLIEVRV